MRGEEIIDAIKRLSSDEQDRVVAFVREFCESNQLTPEELGKLAARMVDTENPAEAKWLEEKIIRGFYGGEPHG